MHSGWGLSDESNGKRGRVEGRELLGGRGEGGKLCGWGWGCWFMVREMEEGKRKRKKREWSVTVLYIFPCRSAVLFSCVVIFFSLPLFFLSLFFFFFPLSLDSPVVR